MNVGSVSGSHPFQYPSSDGIEHAAFNSVSGELAVLMLDRQEQQKETQHQELASARQDFQRQLAREVESLRDQADAEFLGAVVEGSLAAASGGFGIAGAVKAGDHATWESKLSEGLGKLAQPMGKLVGHNYGIATSKAAQGLEQVAKNRIDDAREGIRDADSRQNKALDWLSSMLDRDAATTTAILSNKV